MKILLCIADRWIVRINSNANRNVLHVNWKRDGVNRCWLYVQVAI